MSEKEIEKYRRYEELEKEGRLYVLPVALGTIVYDVKTCSCRSGFACKNGEKKNPSGLVPDERICMTEDDLGRKCRKIYAVPFEPTMIGQMGRGTFETKEEAVEFAKRTSRWL